MNNTCCNEDPREIRHNETGGLIDAGCGWGDLCGAWAVIELMMSRPIVVLS